MSQNLSRDCFHQSQLLALIYCPRALRNVVDTTSLPESQIVSRTTYATCVLECRHASMRQYCVASYGSPQVSQLVGLCISPCGSYTQTWMLACLRIDICYCCMLSRAVSSLTVRGIVQIAISMPIECDFSSVDKNNLQPTLSLFATDS